MKRRQLLNTVCVTAVGVAVLTTVACTNPRPSETATHTLTATYWKLTSLGDTPVTVYEERVPYMELQAEPARESPGQTAATA